MRAIGPALLAVAALFGCGPDEDRQEGSHPRGSIVGTVSDLRTGLPLAGVTASVLVVEDGAPAVVSATSDDLGGYALPELPAGTALRVDFTLTGYVDRFGMVVIPDGVGNFPQGNGIAQVDVAMAAGDARIAGTIFIQDGEPAADAVVGVDLRGAGFDLVVETTAGADGSYLIDGLPGAPAGFGLALDIAPYDDDGDGQADYDALSLATATFPEATTRLDVDLRIASADLLLIASDIADGQHPGSAPIGLTFNRPLDPALTSAALIDTSASNRVIATVATIDGAGLSVAAADASAWPEGHLLQLSVSARAISGAAATPVQVFQVVSGPPPTLDAVTGVQVTPAANWNTTGFTVSWLGVDDAAGYHVFARDDGPNSTYVKLTAAAVATAPAPSTAVTLPGSFDYYPSDGRQTPFLWSTAVDFAVAPVDVYGNIGDLAAANPVSLTDTVPPTAVANQTGSADNSGNASPITIDLMVTFSEYIDTAASNLQVTVPAADTVDSIVLDPGLLGATITISIPASTDGTGPFTIDGAVDTSGNPMTPLNGTLFDTIELVGNGGFEGCSMAGWTLDFIGTAPLPSAVTDEAASGTCSARMGYDGGPNENGYSYFYQAFNLPAGASNITASAQWLRYSTGTGDTTTCYVTASSTIYLFNTTTGTGGGFATASANITSFAGQSATFLCFVLQDASDQTRLYVDNLSIQVTP